MPPRRPAFGSDVRAIIVAVGPTQDQRATIGLVRAQADVRVLWDDGIALLVRRVEIGRVELAMATQRRARDLVPPDDLLLVVDLAAFPVLSAMRMRRATR